MKNPLSLLLIIALSLPFVSCLDQPTGRRGTVFHSAEDTPRGNSSKPPRYGRGGTHSPTEKKNTASNLDNNSGSQRLPPSDPDGIVKPRGMDSNDEESDIVSSNEPELGKDEPLPDPKLDPTPSKDVPYAEAVPGKYGLVYSPFVSDKSKALVNVTDENDVPLPPGTEVLCPITKKHFRVP